jgi:hypothetical protein
VYPAGRTANRRFTENEGGIHVRSPSTVLQAVGCGPWAVGGCGPWGLFIHDDAE